MSPHGHNSPVGRRSTTGSAAVSERYFAGPARVRRLLDDMAGRDEDLWTQYLRSESPLSRTPKLLQCSDEGPTPPDWIRGAVNVVGSSETGAAVFWSDRRAWVVLPPFPIKEDRFANGIAGSRLLDVYERGVTVGVVLLRMGRYAIGVVQRDRLLASKTDTRHVKRRHRAGGTSQRRFMRSRDRLIRELYDEACEVTRRVFEPYLNDIDYVLTGGERQTINGFLKRCMFFEKSNLRVMARLLAVDRPNRRALEGIHREIWKSRVIVFDRTE